MLQAVNCRFIISLRTSKLISNDKTFQWLSDLRDKCPYSEFFCSVFSRIRLNTKRYTPYLSVPECGKIWIRKSPNTDTFYAVYQLFKYGELSSRDLARVVSPVFFKLISIDSKNPFRSNHL